ncbi:hypothetical protein [Streptomyces sp. NPDC058953]|uniref:hypothetical protein n=1 Tax=Streptomyces sp. NPDC058953 TaxID=3346676 RepID=UPI0036B74063
MTGEGRPVVWWLLGLAVFNGGLGAWCWVRGLGDRATIRRIKREAEDELMRARESLTAVTAPLAVRAELRGRLDAYKAKTSRHGLAEDPVLIERYDAARRMLWSAPCDLRVAEQAVLRYQRAAAEALAHTEPGRTGSGGGEGGV